MTISSSFNDAPFPGPALPRRRRAGIGGEGKQAPGKKECRRQDGPRWVRGNGETYNLHLKTADLLLPWQSYRSSFPTGAEWREIRLPFGGFEPHRTGVPLDTGHLRSLGLVAIGRAFTAELCVAEIGLYRDRSYAAAPQTD